jgi:hypothetical protein
MNNPFDELTKDLAQSVTRRGAVKKFGVGLAGMALACLGGLASKAQAGDRAELCRNCVNVCVASGFSHNYCRQRECSIFCKKIEWV